MTSDYLLKTITKDGRFRAYAVDATQTVREAQRRHRSMNAATVATGRAMVGGLMLSTAVLEGQQNMTIEIDGKGPVGMILVDVTADGNVKSYVQHPAAELPVNAANEVDVGRAVGRNGYLQVIENLNSTKPPHVSTVHLVSGEIGDDFTYYLTQSEQIPSALDTSVLVNANDTVGVAGGFLVQKMPGATDAQIDRVERKIKQAPSVNDLLADGERPEKILNLILGRDNLKILQRMPVQFRCSCSKKRFGRDIARLRPDQIKQMITQDHGAQVICHFCGNRYQYSESDLRDLLLLSENRNSMK